MQSKSNNMRGNRMINKVEKIIASADQFELPFNTKKIDLEEVLLEQKLFIEDRFQSLAPDFYPDEDTLYELWGDAISETDEGFLTEKEKMKMIDFYLQDLMRCYAEKIGITMLKFYELYGR